MRYLRRLMATTAATVALTLAAWPAYGAPVADAPVPLIVGHRGTTVGAPENTVAAFRFARAAGVDVLELDVRWTKNRTMIVMHDETLDRTTNCYGAVAQKTSLQVRGCDAGSYAGLRWAREKIPTFATALGYARDSGLQVNVEAKVPTGQRLSETDAEDFVAKLAAYGVTDRTVVSSFSASSLARIRAAGDAAGLASLRYALISSTSGGLSVTAVRSAGTVYLPSYRSVTAARVAEYRAAGIAVWVYGVTSSTDLTKASKLGADALVVDDPRTAVARLRSS